MLVRAGRTFLAAAERRPQSFAIGTSAPCVVAGDAVAQQVERRFDGEPLGLFDGQRCLSVFGWSVWYLGFVQYRLYLHAVDPLITVERFGRALTPLIKSTACNLVITPFINIPLYYLWSTTRLPYAQWDLVQSIDV